MLRVVQYTFETVNHLLFRTQNFIQKVDPLQTDEQQQFMSNEGHCAFKDCFIGGCEECASTYTDAVLAKKQFLFCDFCSQCQMEIAEKIFIPYCKVEFYAMKYHFKLIRRHLDSCQSAEDVAALLMQGGVIPDAFGIEAFENEINYYVGATQ